MKNVSQDNNKILRNWAYDKYEIWKEEIKNNKRKKEEFEQCMMSKEIPKRKMENNNR